jgi:hypothetical protein
MAAKNFFIFPSGLNFIYYNGKKPRFAIPIEMFARIEKNSLTLHNKTPRFFLRNGVLSVSPYFPPALPYGMEHSTALLLSWFLSTIFD